jgi:hypothetical protein
VQPATSPRSAFKRPAEAPVVDQRQFKRIKGGFNSEYLHLLNRDIMELSSTDVRPDQVGLLRPSQLGLTKWTAIEKERLFDGLSLFGRSRVPEIAHRIGSKGELEVEQYLRFLRDNLKEQRRQRNQRTYPLQLEDMEAAVELSPACCSALEEVADDISLKQEQYEGTRERRRWGDDNWLITKSNYKDIEQAAPSNMPSITLFRSARWLKLCENIFMNSSLPEGNWTSVDTEPPAIRATALEDFYSLVVSITRRLVLTTIFISSSRIKARTSSHRRPPTRRVRPGDVEAAVLSLGLKTSTHEFWARCAERLKIEVYEDVNDDAVSLQEPMSYDAVARALGSSKGRDQADLDKAASSDEADSPPASSSHDEPGSGSEEADESASGSDGSLLDAESVPQLVGIDNKEALRDTKELWNHTVHDLPYSRPARQKLITRVQWEMEWEARAEAVDRHKSAVEERRLWDMLSKEPPQDLAEVEMPEDAGPGSRKRMVDELGLEINDWMDSMRYNSQWETPMNLGANDYDGPVSRTRGTRNAKI